MPFLPLPLRDSPLPAPCPVLNLMAGSPECGFPQTDPQRQKCVYQTRSLVTPSMRLEAGSHRGSPSLAFTGGPPASRFGS